ncbi:hypothetical protein K470DRAFT_268494 [Piedraia hortae CBS 480.64]|uniref:Uncharacterized protein n=1 Tax=Piedraia hortae CBS 480.64 TaxID=1314780 RepID=A0A6A7C6B8_9PEZI|nr:hypothetical protein K470DRAFT_268494 [Piedraia hortae CBS 480.64]
MRRDQILTTGFPTTEDVKIIRRPKLVMVIGVPLDTRITNGGGPENDEWIKDISKKHAVRIELVSWLYTAKQLDHIRAQKKQTKYSLLMEVTSEQDQQHLVKEGMYHGALWLPVKLCDAMTRTVQCFKSWK